ncbi:hypothetical protein H1164_13130 [Thermoactinomyces daqus]|uniref:Uncharacterized protein n=1 Tax=Thermoactinomyces daqus TaxID=1329516 RepID=A0A7W1XBX2_9BACL|nr:hypothetical protein [Thermoactinomyces daqus]MBA4543831.1 hypothetical protein [Thermoactinomyces daqus]
MTEREEAEKRLLEARERGRNSAMFQALRKLAAEAKGHEIEVLRNLQFDIPLSEEIIRERRGE